MAMEMNRQDLLELYQLAAMYARCYGLELKELLEGISEKYKKKYRRRRHPQFQQSEMRRAKKNLCGKYGQDDSGTAQ